MFFPKNFRCVAHSACALLGLRTFIFSSLSMFCDNVQLYFEKITELVVTGADTQLLRDAFVSLATDSGLHPLVPYFTQFVADEVRILAMYLASSIASSTM